MGLLYLSDDNNLHHSFPLAAKLKEMHEGW